MGNSSLWECFCTEDLFLFCRRADKGEIIRFLRARAERLSRSGRETSHSSAALHKCSLLYPRARRPSCYLSPNTQHSTCWRETRMQKPAFTLQRPACGLSEAVSVKLNSDTCIGKQSYNVSISLGQILAPWLFNYHRSSCFGVCALIELLT